MPHQQQQQQHQQQETESELVAIKFTEDFTPAYTILAAPSQQKHHITARAPTVVGAPSQIPQSSQAMSFIHPFQQQQQQALPQVSQPQSLAAVSGRKGLFGDLFYVGNDNCYYCLRFKCNYRFRQDINKHVKTRRKDESAKFPCEVC